MTDEEVEELALITDKANDLIVVMNSTLSNNPLSIDQSLRAICLAYWLILLHTDAADTDECVAIEHAMSIMLSSLPLAQLLKHEDGGINLQ